ncbi:MAG TPA: DUF4286 family protein [Pyrinomonadaceae bacterium]|nr:DUF4286 family protein [Pyrinomonadaceae bacterium]
MIIYEVTAKVASHLSDDYEQYMRDRHIPDVLATGAFLSAGFYITENGVYQVRYQAANQDALENYINEHATRLRKDVQDRFPSGVEFSRHEWSLIKTWKC